MRHPGTTVRVLDHGTTTAVWNTAHLAGGAMISLANLDRGVARLRDTLDALSPGGWVRLAK